MIAPSVPSAGSVTLESVSWSPSRSVQLSGTDTGAPTAVLRDDRRQVGAREIAIVTVVFAESPVPSLALYLNVSVPNSPASGV